MASGKSSKKEIKKYRTPLARISFPHLAKASPDPQGNPKFSCVLLFDKKADLTELKKAAYRALVEKFGEKMVKKNMSKFKSPFRDGEEKADQYDGYEGKIFITATSKNKPRVVDGQREDIDDVEAEVYPGCYVKAMVNLYAYDQKGNKGVAFGLISVQKQKDGEPFAGISSDPEEDYDSVEDEGEDEDDFGDTGDDDAENTMFG